ncbi:unnamed protein product, partial [Pylaiella littoralis]
MGPSHAAVMLSPRTLLPACLPACLPVHRRHRFEAEDDERKAAASAAASAGALWRWRKCWYEPKCRRRWRRHRRYGLGSASRTRVRVSRCVRRNTQRKWDAPTPGSAGGDGFAGTDGVTGASRGGNAGARKTGPAGNGHQRDASERRGERR